MNEFLGAMQDEADLTETAAVFSDWLQDRGQPTLLTAAMEFLRARGLLDQFKESIQAGYRMMHDEKALPARWVYVSFRVEVVGKTQTLEDGRVIPYTDNLHWVVGGTLAACKKRIDAIWEQVREHDLKTRELFWDRLHWIKGEVSDIRLVGTGLYPNNYKIDSRKLIKEGRYTP